MTLAEGKFEPHYPKSGNGRQPVKLERMLRIYFLQHWLNLSDPAAEEALYESRSTRKIVGVDLGQESVCWFGSPDLFPKVGGFDSMLSLMLAGGALWEM